MFVLFVVVFFVFFFVFFLNHFAQVRNFKSIGIDYKYKNRSYNNYVPSFEEVGSLLVLACPCVRPRLLMSCMDSS